MEKDNKNNLITFLILISSIVIETLVLAAFKLPSGIPKIARRVISTLLTILIAYIIRFVVLSTNRIKDKEDFKVEFNQKCNFYIVTVIIEILSDAVFGYAATLG